VPGDADGAASFRGHRGTTLLTHNHELSGAEGDPGVPKVHGGDPVPTYDPNGLGGCSTIVLDRRGRVISRYPVIAGTVNNCAGGLTPWGTWLTCEETTTTLDGVPHGYVFEVDPTGRKTTAEPVLGMGRYPHEAVCIDPRTSTAYLTEDNGQIGLVYRYVPDRRRHRYGSLHDGGTLTAMRIEGVASASEITEVGRRYRVSWTPVPDGVDATTTTSLAESFADGTVTRSRKWEGSWFGNGKAYLGVSFQDDDALGRTPNHGQIFAYDPKRERIELVLYIPADDPTFDSPDNITIAPDGAVWIAEDGDGEQYITGMGSDGQLFPFARNATDAQNEFTGVNFSPDGSTLFFSIQDPSTTFAVSGPFRIGGPGRH
jgi:secreted PhoX family phosphatase